MQDRSQETRDAKGKEVVAPGGRLGVRKPFWGSWPFLWALKGE